MPSESPTLAQAPPGAWFVDAASGSDVSELRLLCFKTRAPPPPLLPPPQQRTGPFASHVHVRRTLSWRDIDTLVVAILHTTQR